jgi:hypothetical protein
MAAITLYDSLTLANQLQLYHMMQVVCICHHASCSLVNRNAIMGNCHNRYRALEGDTAQCENVETGCSPRVGTCFAASPAARSLPPREVPAPP